MLSLGGLNSGSLKDLQLVISFSTDFAIHTKVRGRAWSRCLGNIAKIKLPMKVTIQFLLPIAPGGRKKVATTYSSGSVYYLLSPSQLHWLKLWGCWVKAPLTNSRSLVSTSAVPFVCGARSLPCAGARRRCAAEPVENDWVASLLNIIVMMW